MDDRHFATSGTITLAILLMLTSVILLVTPLNLFGGWLPTPFFPLIVIFLYGLDRPASLPPLVSFLSGLLLDLLFGVGIGPWATVFLLVHASIIWQRSYFAGRDTVVLTTGFAIASLAALVIYWIEMSVLMGRTMPLGALMWQGLVTVFLFPFCLNFFRRTIGRQRPSLAG